MYIESHYTKQETLGWLYTHLEASTDSYVKLYRAQLTEVRDIAFRCVLLMKGRFDVNNNSLVSLLLLS